MADSDVGIKLVAEDSSFKTAMANANQLIKQMTQECKEAASGVGDLGSKQEAYTKVLDAQQQKLELLTKKHSEASDKLKTLAEAYEKAKEAGDPEAISKAAEAYTRQSTEVSKLETSMSQCRTAIQETTQQMQESTKASEEGSSAAEKFGKAWEGVKAGLEAAVAAVAAMGAAVVAAGKEIVDLANQTAEAGDHIDKMSQKIGISAEAYQEWAYVCERSGASVDNLQAGMKTLAGVIGDAGNGSDTAAKKLEAVGLSIEDLDGKSQEQQLQLVIDALQKMGSWSERTAAATDLLGKSATDLGAVLNMTAKDTQALKDEAHEYGMIMSDEAVAASAAFEDSLSRMNGTINGVKNALMAEFLPGLTSIMDGISDLVAGVDGADEKIQSGIDQVLAAFDKVVPAVLEILTRVVQTVAEKGPEIISSLVDRIIDNLPALVEAGAQIIASLASALIQALPRLLEKIPEIIAAIIKGFTGQDFSEIGKHIWDGVTAIFEGIGAFFTDVVTVIKTAFDGIGQWFSDIFHAAREGIEMAFETIGQWFSDIFQAARSGIEGIFQNIGTWFTDRWHDIQTAFESVGNWFSEKFTAAKEGVQKAFQDVGSWFGDRWKDIQDAWKAVDKWMGDKFGAAWDAIKKAFEPFVKYFETIWENVKQIFSVVESVLKGDFEAAWNGIKAIWDNCVNFFKSIWDGIVNVFSGAFNAFSDIGSKIIEGIKNGVGKLWEGFKGWFGNLWTGLLDGVKGIFGIHSPSKEFEQIGGYIIKGFVYGIKNNAWMVDNAMNRAFGDVSNIKYVQPQIRTMAAGQSGAAGTADAAAAAGQTQINLQIDGKTFARLTTPYIDMQQGRAWARQVALGVAG